MNETIKILLDTIDNMNKEEAIDYIFKSYYAFERDNEVANILFIQLGKYIFNIKFNNNDNLNKLQYFYKKDIVDAAYIYYYENKAALKGPLQTVFSELLTNNVEEPVVEPYIDLMKTVIRTKGKNYL